MLVDMLRHILDSGRNCYKGKEIEWRVLLKHSSPAIHCNDLEIQTVQSPLPDVPNAHYLVCMTKFRDHDVWHNVPVDQIQYVSYRLAHVQPAFVPARRPLDEMDTKSWADE